ncbi:MAG: hypothetical protein ACR2P3_05495, partial [Geminicoccaceae bacterium]
IRTAQQDRTTGIARMRTAPFLGYVKKEILPSSLQHDKSAEVGPEDAVCCLQLASKVLSFIAR